MARASTVPLRLYASTQSLSDTPIFAASAAFVAVSYFSFKDELLPVIGEIQADIRHVRVDIDTIKDQSRQYVSKAEMKLAIENAILRAHKK